MVSLGLWTLLAALRVFPEWAFPAPSEVAKALWQQTRSGELWKDLAASLFRVSSGYVLAVVFGVPIGMVLGHSTRPRLALLPLVNFMRSLSPLAWIPFAVLWFGVGNRPAIFLIFMASFFPVVVAVMAAVANIPAIRFQVARDHGMRGFELMTEVTFPAIMPQLITTLRVVAGVAWMVVVAAEMIAGRDGLGFAIWDSRNGLRIDLLVAGMVVIGLIGVALDRLLAQLTRLPWVRWGYGR